MARVNGAWRIAHALGQSEEIAMDARVMFEDGVTAVKSELILASRKVYEAKSRAEILSHIHRALSAIQETGENGCERLRAKTRELAGIA